MTATGFAVLAYLIGSISFAIITSKLFGLPDPRSFGSKNPGATNMLRTGNKKAAALTLLGDALKGWVAVFIAQHAGVNDQGIAYVIMGVILGHMWPIFFSFYGGKGVATALGILLAVNPLLGLSCLGVWLAVLKLSKISSLSALSAAICSPILAYFIVGNRPQTFAIVAVSALLIYRHKKNIADLLKGSENKVSR